MDIIAVEPNIKSHPEFEIVDYKEAIENADIVVFLVSHKEFQDIEIDQTKEVLSFCKLNVKRPVPVQ
jgi:UDP-N-acetyl-D-mannosaminuronic acid dehydrogenase